MKRLLKIIVYTALLGAFYVFTARMLFPLPDIADRRNEYTLPVSMATPIGAAVGAESALHPGKSGILPLRDGLRALVERLILVETAAQSIDAQYYIWHDDISGILLLDALSRAAQRGVRVRLLLDDNGVPGLDGIMAALNSQENFEIRLFNPSTVRTPKYAGYTFDFLRMNRRMHNKSFIVDGAIAIVGGRNIGDEYFDVVEDNFYVDLDVLVAGPVVAETSTMFDQYWNSQSVFAVETIINRAGSLDDFSERAAEIAADPSAAPILHTVRGAATPGYIDRTKLQEWTDVQLIADDPRKGQGIATQDQLMINQMGTILGSIETRLDLVSAYFVPGHRGTDWLSEIALSGKDVRVVTNAMNTTDVPLVHAGYTKYRRELLKAGVRLYELKLRGGTSDAGLHPLPLGLSGASLHAKTFAIDGERVFIGSFNFDPRSALLNSEMGYVIESASLARHVSNGVDGPLLLASYQPDLTPEEKMIWQEPLYDGSLVIYQEEPGASWIDQLTIAVLGLLPIEWLL